MSQRNYNNVTSLGTLSGPVASSATTLPTNTFTGYPAVPFTITVDRNTATEEICLVTGIAGANLTVTRGYDGTAGQAHLAGATVEHTSIAMDFAEANTHVNATSAVHGVTGALVGAQGAQSIYDKTLVSPVAQADVTAGDAVVAYVPSGASARNLFRGISPAGADVTVITGAGALSTAGITSTTTLRVNGATTLDSTLTVAGAVTVPTPTLAAHAARKDYVDNANTTLSGRVTTTENTLAAATSLQSSNTLALRDANGRIQVASPALGAEAGNKTYIDAGDTALSGRVAVFEADGGWLTLTPAAGFSTGASGHARYRVRGGVCYWSLYLAYTGAIGALVTVTTFPAGARPTVQLAFPSSYSGVSTEMTLSTAGALTTVTSTAAQGIIAAGSHPVT